MIILYDYPSTSGVGDVVVAQNHVVEGNRWRRDFFQFIVILHEEKCLLLLWWKYIWRSAMAINLE